jgi:antitoxin component of MazEF toxin-antitoxin module
MGTTKVEYEDIRIITQNSTGTYSVTLPIARMRKLGWRKGQKITVKQQGEKLVIEDWKPKK